jgi:uncharacterized protein (DUF1330 family)
MSGYVIAHVEVHDPQEYRRYLSAFMDAFKPFDGRILVATDKIEVLEGEWPKVRTIVMEFPSTDRAREWYESEQYQKIAQHRFQAAKTNMVIVEGFSKQGFVYTTKSE